MPFQPRSNVDVSTVADKWSRKTAAAGPDLLAGYSAPRRSPKADPEKSGAAWLANTQAALPGYVAGVSGYSEDAAIASMRDNGVQRYVAAANSKKANYGKVAAVLIPALRSGAASLPQDRSSPSARDARMLAMVNYSRGLRGKFRKSKV